MEYLMKGILVSIFMLVLILQTSGDFAIHEDRKKKWHLWKGMSLALLMLSPFVFYLMMDTPVIWKDFLYSWVITYCAYRWLFFDILMNERLEQRIDYIGDNSYFERLLKRIFPRQQPQGYMWIRFIAWFAWNVVWWFRYEPGVWIKPFNMG